MTSILDYLTYWYRSTWCPHYFKGFKVLHATRPIANTDGVHQCQNGVVQCKHCHTTFYAWRTLRPTWNTATHQWSTEWGLITRIR